MLGLNLRLPEINAAIAKIQMKKLPKFLQARKKKCRTFNRITFKIKSFFTNTKKA